MCGWGVVEARGDGQLEQVDIVRFDGSWRPITGTERTINADAVFVGSGFVPSTQLAQLFGCALDADGPDAWRVRHGPDLQTSVPGVFVAGGSAGYTGARQARVSGTVAGLGAAMAVGRHVDDGDVARARRDLRQHRRASLVFDAFSAVADERYRSIPDDVILCRCEEVTMRQVRDVVRSWSRDMNTVRRLTRAGMGMCQGRVCAPTVARILTTMSTGDEARPLSSTFTARAPLRPLCLETLAMDPDGNDPG
jgi:bacterioferritin-associated ferredoxin